jgi:segregation and condensation protein B
LNTPDLEKEKVRSVIEAILLTAESPVSPGRLTTLIKGLNGRDIREAIDELQKEYENSGHAFTIVEVGGGYQLATRQEFAPWLRKFHRDRKQIRLSQAALEVLSIVAFKQPITRVELDAVRGVSSTGVLQTLMELNMIRIVGRSDGVGKPMLFGSTKEFLIHFGLKTLADLPKPKELEELLAEEGRKVQSQLGLGFDEEVVEDESEDSAEQGDQVEEQDEVERLQRADDSDAPNENGIAPGDDEQSEEENDA